MLKEPQSQKTLSKEDELLVYQARNNFVHFEVLTNPLYVPNWHHRLIAHELENIEKNGDRDYKVLIITVPPRHGKSQQCSIDFPPWYLGRNPQKEIIAASYSIELAQRFGGRAKDKMDSLQFKTIFPDVTLKEDTQAKSRWATTKGGGYVAAGVGGPITGHGANVLLIDDPIKNREEANSETVRENIWEWFTSTAFTRLEPHGVVVLVLTRWHLDDLAGRIQAHKNEYRTKVINLPAVANRDEPPYRSAGAPLWPERYDHKALAEIKAAIGPYDWSALYQGNPILTENQEFKPHWIKRIAELNVDVMNCRRFLTIDTAMSKKAHADYTGFCDNRVNKENFWHLKAWGMKIGPEELVDAIFALHKVNRYEAIGIEKTTYTQGLKPYLDSEQRKRNTFLPLVELSHNQTNKEVRLRGLIPLYASGSIFHIDGQCKELEEQMTHFPVNINDDILDATAYQLQLVAGDKSGQARVYTPDIE